MRRLVLLFSIFSTLSCSVLNTVGRGVQSLYPGNGEVTQTELRDFLFDFSNSFSVLVTEAADRIATQTTEPKMRRLALLWKIRMPPAAQLAASDHNPRSGYVESLTVAVAQRQYFEDGAGSALFGLQQSIALDAAKEIEKNALHLGESFLTPVKLADLHADVEELAKKHPLRGEFLRESIQAGLSQAETGGMFDDIIRLPMAPFRAIAGVESGAQAIHEFNATAAQFTEIIDQLPQRTRWQMELLSYDLQEQGGVLQQSLHSFETMAESADRLSLAAENAPEDVRIAIASIAEEIDQRNVALKSLLDDLRATLTDVGTTAGTVAPLIDGLTRASEQLNHAGVSWAEVLKELNAPGPPPPPGTPPPRPFDITEYEQTAIAIRSTAEEMRGLLRDVEKAGDGISTAFVDRMLRNGIILIVVFFAALLGYRLIASRIAPTR